MKQIILNKGRERSVLNRHPWIFSGAIQSGAAESGELVEVVAASGKTLGYGAYSPASQIRVRMLSFGDSAPDLSALVRSRISSAVARRESLFAAAKTNALRLVNAENDALPGVVVDFYAGFAICQLTSAGAERMRDEIAAALLAALPTCRGVSARLDVDVRTKEGIATEPAFVHLLGEEPPAEIEISEGPCKFLVDVRKGHKTGFYLDQRDARAAVGRLAAGAEVLNCFSFTGGFGLYARQNGATKVTQVDISQEAIDRARRNELLQDARTTEMVYETADVFQYLRTCRDAGRMFDLIVLDPPKFAATKSQLMRAARGYKDINLLAMKLLRPGGTLATFSCSGAMDAVFFDQILAEAARDAKRDFQIIGRTRAGEDHPVALDFPEGAYLKGVILRAL